MNSPNHWYTLNQGAMTS